jgi:hypothetical protein
MTRKLILVLLLLLVTGCGNPKISGKVVFSDDQTPVPRGTVMFHTGNKIARGEIQHDGSYVVGSLKGNDGLPKGTYQITIKGTQMRVGARLRDTRFVNVIDQKYENPGTSGLVLDVKRSQTFDIQVDRFRK